MSEEMRFVVIITDFDDIHLPATGHAFHYADTAREWVGRIHGHLFDGSTGAFVEEAFLYKIGPTGQFIQMDEWSGYDRGDGIASGWRYSCQWTHPEGWTCDHTPVKGDKLCRFHRKDPKYCAPESGLMGGGFVERIPVEEYAKYRDYKGAPSLYGWAALLGGIGGSTTKQPTD